MAELTPRTTGTPCWVDVTIPDVEAAIAFYGRLFGWEPSRIPDPAAGGYTMFNRGGQPVAAASPPQDETVPPHWSVYLATDDADATAARMREAGGDLLAEPFDVFDQGRMAVARDPAGAVICLWQAGQMPGGLVRSGPGTLNWCECQTRDRAAALPFYEQVFGYETEAAPMGEGREYTVLKVGGEPVAGMLEIEPEWGGNAESHWAVVFEVEDCDATVARAQELGGTVIRPPVDLEGVGRFAVLADPFGAGFQVIK
jgi:predicted enzyme related to lactoylglutathione lyase